MERRSWLSGLLGYVLARSHVDFLLMIRRPPRSTRTDTLSLHDALPICSATRPPIVSAQPPAITTTPARRTRPGRSEEHTSQLQSLMRLSYAVLCLKKKILVLIAADPDRLRLDVHHRPPHHLREADGQTHVHNATPVTHHQRTHHN